MPVKMLTEADARQYIANNDTGRLATCDEQGQPYIVPLNYIYFNNHIYFHCAHEGKKLDNIRINANVCFEVSHTDKLYFADKACNCGTRYTSVLVFGKAVVIEEAAAKVEMLNALTEQFAKGRSFPCINEKMAQSCTVVRIEIQELHGKKNVDPDQV